MSVRPSVRSLRGARRRPGRRRVRAAAHPGAGLIGSEGAVRRVAAAGGVVEFTACRRSRSASSRSSISRSWPAEPPETWRNFWLATDAHKGEPMRLGAEVATVKVFRGVPTSRPRCWPSRGPPTWIPVRPATSLPRRRRWHRDPDTRCLVASAGRSACQRSTFRRRRAPSGQLATHSRDGICGCRVLAPRMTA